MNGGANGIGVSKGERFNKLPLVIVGFIFALFAFGLYYAAMSRVEKTKTYEGVAESLEANRSNQEYQSIAFVQGRKDGLVNAKAPIDPNAGVEEQGRESDLADQIAKMIEKQRLAELDRNNKIQNQLLEHQYKQAQLALDGDIAVKVFDRGTRDGRPNTLEPDRVIQASSASPNGIPGSVNPREYNKQQNVSDGRSHSLSNPKAAALSSTDTSGVIASKDFVSGDYRNDFTLFEGVKSPESKYELMTGTLIPGVMISAANSELPGDLVAQVTQDVYDSVTGRYLLIPQGSKLFGRYDSFAALGSERLLMVWDRLIMPDGESITIGSIQGYDERGMSGAKDRVITHFWKTLFNAFLLSVVNASGETLVDESADSSGIVANISANFGTTTSNAFDDYLRSRLKIKPTFEIRSGYRFNIIVNRDITFPEPFEFGYTRLEIK